MPPVTDDRLQHLAYFDRLGGLFDRLRPAAAARDRAGNRRLFYDQYAALLLLYFFNPALTSLRALQQATGLAKVRDRLGVRRASLGALSEASRVFDARLLGPIVAELAARCRPALPPAEWAALRGLTAVDGTLLPALPRMAWALWGGGRAAKLHLHFDALAGLPLRASLTAGGGPEREELRRGLEPGRLYVADRGYASFQLLQDIRDAGSSFIARLCHHTRVRVLRERPLGPAAAAAGVVGDQVARLGTPHHKRLLAGPVRVVRVAVPGGEDLLLATDRLDLDADLVALGYRRRWQVELFFRWLKCVLGCRHLLGESPNGVALQVYAALIASLLIALWTGRTPTKRTFEMVCHYFGGWASAEELVAHVQTLHEQPDTG
jgi:hypothetical protein